MRKIQNENLAQLLMQMRFTPANKRQKQLDNAEKLLALIKPDQQYPFEFVYFHIIGHHAQQEYEDLINGDELAADLKIFVAKLSSQIAPAVSEQQEKIYTIEELAKKLNVATKTIDRWRKKDLVARKFLFEDGTKRLGFSQSKVDAFFETHPELIENATNFSRLSRNEKYHIIKLARNLADDETLSRHQVIKRLVEKTGKAHETIRYTLLNYETENPDKPVFKKKATGIISPLLAKELYEQFVSGVSIKELMEKYNRSRSSIYRLINKRRTRAILAKRIEFMDSSEFLEENVKSKILVKDIETQKPVLLRKAEPTRLSSDSLPAYLETAKQAPILKRDQETELFRRYNYLKYLASQKRVGMNPAKVSGNRLTEIENYLVEAEEIKNKLIESFLRLVVAIAKKHSSGAVKLADLISEGNFSLMRAVEKFDYTKGYRFATYASWAIAKDFAKKIPAESARQKRQETGFAEHIQRDLRMAGAADVETVERARHSLIQVIKDNLDEREQYIIINHFGLLGTIIRKKRKSLQQIGDDLGLSKERVRQIELIGLQKLKHSLSMEQFELLKE